MSFDPYYEWLGIPPDEQPADYYRLLGIRRFERNPNVIEHAAERQLLLLKTLQNGPHSELTQQLMNEVSTARICLLDRQRKTAYDTKLQQRVADEKRARRPAPLPLRPPVEELPALEPLRLEDPAPLMPASRRRRARMRANRQKLAGGGAHRPVQADSPAAVVKIMLGGLVAGVYIGATLILIWVYGGGGRSRSPDAGTLREKDPAAASVETQGADPGEHTAGRSMRAAPNTAKLKSRVPGNPPTNRSKSREGQTGDLNSYGKSR